MSCSAAAPPGSTVTNINAAFAPAVPTASVLGSTTLPSAATASLSQAASPLLPGTAQPSGVNPNPNLAPPGVAQSAGTAQGTLAYLLAAKAAAARPGAVGDTATAVPGGGRGVRVVHRPSADVLRIKLRLVDLVQGSSALQSKVTEPAIEMQCSSVSVNSIWPIVHTAFDLMMRVFASSPDQTWLSIQEDVAGSSWL